MTQLAMAVNSRGLRMRTDPTSQLIQEALLDEIVRLRLDEPYLIGPSRRGKHRGLDRDLLASTGEFSFTVTEGLKQDKA